MDVQPWRCPDEVPSLRRSLLSLGTLAGTSWERSHIPYLGVFESMIFLFPRWDMLVPWRVFLYIGYHQLLLIVIGR